MQRKMFLIVISALLLLSGISHSEEIATSPQNLGSGNNGFFFAAGYDGSTIDSKFYQRDGTYTGKHTGWLNGVDVEGRYEMKRLWTRGRFEYSQSSDIDAKSPSGRTVGSRREDLYRYELALGYKALNLGPSTLTPYIGIGYRQNNTKGSSGSSSAIDRIDYKWGYAPIGLNYVYNFRGWSLGADAALQVPFSMGVHGTDSSTGAEGSADVHSGIGFRAEVPIAVDICKPKTTDRFKILGLLTPYYQYWRQEASETITFPGHTGYFTKNRENIFGIKVGIGINF